MVEGSGREKRHGRGARFPVLMSGALVLAACTKPSPNAADYRFEVTAIDSDRVEARGGDGSAWETAAGRCRGPDCAVVIDDERVAPTPLSVTVRAGQVERPGILISQLGTAGSARFECRAASCTFDVVIASGDSSHVPLEWGEATDLADVRRVSVHIEN